MTKQEYFDLLVKTSKDGGFPAINVEKTIPGCQFSGNVNRCKYRTNDGKKCAFGLLIPDDKYSHLFEGKSLEGLPDYIQYYFPDGLCMRDMMSVQVVHDKYATYESWNHTDFVQRLLHLPCFKDVVCVDMETALSVQ